jgi:alcohol dehydrogenase (cytochrome c)
MALEKCSQYRKAPAVWKAGESHYGGDTRSTGEPGKKYLRALDVKTGRVTWEMPLEGPGNTWGGVMSTAGGVVFFGNDSGDFSAADAKSGKLLWTFPANQAWKSSPMTYTVGGKQMVAVAAGSSIIAFGVK